MQSRKLNPIPLIIITLAFIGLMFLLVSGKKKPSKADDVILNKLVTATEAEMKAYSPMIDVFGTVESVAVQTFSSPINSYVDKVMAKAGDNVPANSLLVALDTADLHIQTQGFNAQLQQISAQISGEELRFKSNQQALNSERDLLAITQTTMNNSKTLYERGLGAKNPYDQARQQVIQLELSIQNRELAIAQYYESVAQLKAQKQQIQSNINQVRLNQKRARIETDQPSQIIDVMVAEGERVSIGQPLVSGYNSDSLHVKSLIPQKHLEALRIAKGLGEDVLASGYIENKEVMLKLSRFANVADAQHGGVDVYFDIVSGQEHLQVNRNVKLQLNLPAENNVVLLPVTALHAGNRIYRISKEHQLQSLDIVVAGYTQTDSSGQDVEKLMLVRSPDLKQGDWIMTSHLTDALEAQVVDINLDGEIISAPVVKPTDSNKLADSY